MNNEAGCSYVVTKIPYCECHKIVADKDVFCPHHRLLFDHEIAQKREREEKRAIDKADRGKQQDRRKKLAEEKRGISDKTYAAS